MLDEKKQQIAQFYAEAFRYFDKIRPLPKIEVSFYNYVGINHTIRIRNGKIFVRICELCQDMPMNEQRGLAYILVSKLLRKKVPIQLAKIYQSYIKSPEMRQKNTESRREKGYKIISTAKGKYFDLELMFAELNEFYFENEIPQQTLTWSVKKTYRILGHHDPTHNTIVISQSLDEKNVPNFVVQYVLFHEMLHVKHPTKIINGRRYMHTPIFRQEEREFDFFTEAEKWIEQNLGNLKKSVKGKQSFLRRLLDF